MGRLSSDGYVEHVSYARAFNGAVSQWDVSQGDVSKWDVSQVTDMSRMFSYARAFNGDVSKWDVLK